MGVKNLPLIAERLIAAGRDPGEPAAVVERGTHPGPAHGRRTRSATSPSERPPRGCARPRSRSWARWPPCARRSPGSSGAPLHGETRGRHARACAGERARRTAARARRRGGRDAGDPDRAAPAEGSYAAATRIARLLARLPRRARTACGSCSTRLAARGRDARALAGRDRRGDRPRHRGGARRAGVRADVVPERSVAEALVEALAGAEVEGRRVLVARAAEARDVLPDALRERGAEVDVVALYDTVAEPLDAERARGPGARDYVTFTSSSTVRFFLESRRAAAGGRAGRLDRPGHERDRARARAHGARGGRAPRRRRPRGRARGDAAARRVRRDRHAAHRLRPRRRLRRRLPRRDPPHRTPTRRSWTSRTGSRATPCATARSCLRNALPYMPVGVHVAVVDPQVGHRAPRGRAPRGDGRLLVGPDNGVLSLAWERAGGVELAVDVTRSPHRLEPVSATFHGRDVFAPVAAHLAPAPSWPTPASRSIPPSSRSWSCRSRASRTARWWPTRWWSTASATSSLDVGHERARRDGAHARRARRGRGERTSARGDLRADVRRRAARRAARVRGRLPHARAGDQPRRRRRDARARRRTPRCACGRDDRHPARPPPAHRLDQRAGEGAGRRRARRTARSSRPTSRRPGAAARAARGPRRRGPRS